MCSRLRGLPGDYGFRGGGWTTLLAAIASLALQSRADGPAEVHEWGVLLWQDSALEAAGAGGGPWFDPSEPVVLAPVIYLYGDPLECEVTVSSHGRIFDLYPDPDQFCGLEGCLRGLGSAVRWCGLRAGPLVPGVNDRWSSSFDVGIPGFQWALSMWRQPQAMLIARDSDGFLDRFLYYEVDLTGTGFPVPLPPFSPEGAPREETVSGRVLVFHRPDGSSEVSVSVEPVEGLAPGGTLEAAPDAPEGYDCILPLTVIRSWAAGILTEEEIGAMWGTWEPYARYGDWEGDRLVVFPVPAALLDRISTIEIETGTGLEVEYRRFFLGMTSM